MRIPFAIWSGWEVVTREWQISQALSESLTHSGRLVTEGPGKARNEQDPLLQFLGADLERTELCLGEDAEDERGQRRLRGQRASLCTAILIIEEFSRAADVGVVGVAVNAASCWPKTWNRSRHSSIS